MNIYYILPLYVTVNKSLTNAYGNIASLENFFNLHIKVYGKIRFPDFSGGWTGAASTIDLVKSSVQHSLWNPSKIASKFHGTTYYYQF